MDGPGRIATEGWPEPARRALAGLARFLEPALGAGIDPERVRVAAAPGRVNLLGGHTDYSEGFVLPVAIDRYAACAHSGASGGATHELIAVSLDQDDVFAMDLRRLEALRADARAFETVMGGPEKRWRRYVSGVVLEMEAAGLHVPGGSLVVTGDVPMASGLSSSAALEAAVYTALAPPGKADPEAARLCRRAENRWAGVPCGIMDQFASLLAAPRCAVFLDCRDLSHRDVPIPPEAALTVVHSGITRELAAGAYAERRGEVEAAVRILRKVLGPIETLRDVTPEEFAEVEDILPQPLRRRAAHVIGAIARVPEGAGKLALGDLDAFGALMAACHEGLSRDFRVSLPELDTIVEAALRTDGVWGARLTGAGFGGGCVVLHRAGAEAALEHAVRAAYRERFPDTLTFHHLQPVGGARLVWEGAAARRMEGPRA